MTTARLYRFSGYKGASQGKRLADWLPTGAGPNSVLAADMGWLRRRSLDLLRNNPYLRKAFFDLASSEIGVGISPIFQSQTLREQAKSLWNYWSMECDADGTNTFGSILWLAAVTRIVQGECFIRLRPRKPEDGLSVPLQLQVIPPDQLDIGYNQQLSTGVINQGIEFDMIGKRVAYWFWPQNPNESWPPSSMERVRVPAQFVLHHYRQLVPGQIRGEPAAATVMVESHDYDDYRDAELTRKKTRAHYTGAITRSSYDESDYRYDPMTGQALPERGEAPPTFQLEPATFQALYPGEQLTLFEGDNLGSGYSDFQRDRLLAQSAGLGVPYEHMSGDFRGVNDRLYRALVLAYHREMQIRQSHLSIPQVCEPTKNVWLDMAVLSGALDIQDYATKQREYRRVSWRAHTHDDIYPVQQEQAKQSKLQNRLTSRERLIAEDGGDIREIDAEIAADPWHPPGPGDSNPYTQDSASTGVSGNVGA